MNCIDSDSPENHLNCRALGAIPPDYFKELAEDTTCLLSYSCHESIWVALKFSFLGILHNVRLAFLYSPRPARALENGAKGPL